MRPAILMIEDDAFQRETLKRLLSSRFNYTLIEASNAKEGLQCLKQYEAISLVILDLGLPDISGMETLMLIKERARDVPVIILTSSNAVDDAVQALQKGAVDFVAKPAEMERISLAVTNALNMVNLTHEVQRLRRHRQGVVRFEDLIGCDTGLRHAVKMGRKAASTDIPILLTGDVGVGKDIFAKAVHGEGKRNGMPFVIFDCSTTPEHQIKSTLFGKSYEAGDSPQGVLHKARGGTLYLHEIRMIPIEAQAMLLQLLQSEDNLDVRIICSTTNRLNEAVHLGAFREDLLFHLDGLPIHIPNLNERKDDIPALSQHFLKRIAASNGTPLKQLSTKAVSWLKQQQWTNHVDQLYNILQYAALLTNHHTITDDEIEQAIRQKTSINSAKQSAQSVPVILSDGTIVPLSTIEERSIRMVMEYHKHNIAKSCRALGIAKSTFYRKWKGYY